MRLFTKHHNWVCVVCGLLLLPVGGCTILADALDPNLALELGLDPATITGQQGVILVSFVNNTRNPATFYAFEVANANTASSSARNFSLQVSGGDVSNEVLYCPVGLFGPGELDASLTPAFDQAAVVSEDEGDVEVAYAGGVLQSGDAYQCGDVIEIGLSTIVVDEDETYVVTVQVIPGQ